MSTKKIFISLLALLFTAAVSYAEPVSVTVQWDADVIPIEGGQKIERWEDMKVALANEIPEVDDRTWLGKIHLVAIYSRMLRGDEVKENYELGEKGERKADEEGLVALYLFREGSGTLLNDSSPNPMNLAGSGEFSWIQGGGIDITGSSLFVGDSEVNKVVEAVRASGEVTVEAWIQPANLLQSGPARIVTISRDSGSRNLTFGQAADAYVVRCRREGTEDQGTPHIIAEGVVTTELQHVVYAMDNRGAATIYVNGEGVVSLHTIKEGVRWEKLQVFDRYEGGAYDYTSPIAEIATSYDPNGYSAPVSLPLEVDFKADSVSTKYFIMRSCATVDGEEKCSEDSDETDQSKFTADTTVPQVLRPVSGIRVQEVR